MLSITLPFQYVCGSFACLMPPRCGACQVPEEDSRHDGTEVTGSCEQSCWCWESSPSSLEKQLMLWITEPISSAPNTFSLTVKVSRPKGRKDTFRWSPSPISRASCILALTMELLSYTPSPIESFKKQHSSILHFEYVPPHPIHTFFLLVDEMWCNPLELKKN